MDLPAGLRIGLDEGGHPPQLNQIERVTALKAIVGSDVDDQAMFLREWGLLVHMSQYCRYLTLARHVDEESLKARSDLQRQQASDAIRARETGSESLDFPEEPVQLGAHRLPAPADEDSPQAIARAAGECAEYDEPPQHERENTQDNGDEPL